MIVIQTALVIVGISAIVMILIGIPRMLNATAYDDPDKTSRLRKEVEEDGKVISDNSAFLPWIEHSAQRVISKGPCLRNE